MSLSQPLEFVFSILSFLYARIVEAGPGCPSAVCTTFATAFALDFGRYLAAALLLSAVVWIMRRSRLASRKIQTREATASDLRREVLQSMRSVVVFAIGTCLIVAGNDAGIFHFTNTGYGLGFDLLLLAAMILAHDAWFYWTHRAMHTRLLYRRFHLAHHRSVTPTPWAIYSFAVPEAALNFLFVILWQYFTRTPEYVLLSWLLFQVLRNAMGHAGYELMPRWWLESPLTRWINSTTHHDLHHSGGLSTNFGLYFTFWDKLMGTEHPRYRETFERVTRPAASAAPARVA